MLRAVSSFRLVISIDLRNRASSSKAIYQRKLNPISFMRLNQRHTLKIKSGHWAPLRSLVLTQCNDLAYTRFSWAIRLLRPSPYQRGFRTLKFCHISWKFRKISSFDSRFTCNESKRSSSLCTSIECPLLKAHLFIAKIEPSLRKCSLYWCIPKVARS